MAVTSQALEVIVLLQSFAREETPVLSGESPEQEEPYCLQPEGPSELVGELY